jgi:hypothetical protein
MTRPSSGPFLNASTSMLGQTSRSMKRSHRCVRWREEGESYGWLLRIARQNPQELLSACKKQSKVYSAPYCK